MGVDHTIFFGPFAECSWTGKPAHTKKYLCSGDASHRISSSDKFCSTCGAPVISQNVPTGRLTYLFDRKQLHDDIDEAMYEPCSMGGSLGEEGTDYWLSNKKIPAISRKDSLDKYDEGIFAFDALTIQKEMTAFEKFHAKEIAFLRNYYDDVTIKWGVLAYCW